MREWSALAVTFIVNEKISKYILTRCYIELKKHCSLEKYNVKLITYKDAILYVQFIFAAGYKFPLEQIKDLILRCFGLCIRNTVVDVPTFISLCNTKNAAGFWKHFRAWYSNYFS